MKKKRIFALMLLTMRITVIQLAFAICFVCTLSAKEVKAQVDLKRTITLSVEKAEITKIIAEIHKQTGVKFVYSSRAIRAGRKISYTSQEKSIGQFLEEILKPLEISYKIIDDQVLLFKAEPDAVVNKEKLEGNETIPQKIITGRITDALGLPLAGASVVVKGTTRGAITDMDGSFRLPVQDADKTLLISFTGYTTTEYELTGQNNISITLSASTDKLDEVVVVGYGTQKRSDVTGSVVTVAKNRLEHIPATNILQMLQGSVPGLNITQTSSAPGSSASTYIRGLNSINASTDPLIILDGVPFPGSSNDINASDIESVQILKDPSAVAIYGTRGSNGVIIITTIRGASKKPVIRYNTYAGLEYKSHVMTPMSGPEYVQKNVDYTLQKGVTNANKVYDSVINASEIANLHSGTTTDWIKTLSRQGVIQDHNLNISGGSQNVKYYISGELLKQQGVLKGYQYQRVGIRSNLDMNLTQWLTVSTSISYSNNNYDGGQVNLTRAGQMSPYASPYNADGFYTIYPMYPVSVLYPSPMLGLYNPIINRTNNLTGTGYFEIKPGFLPGFKYRLNASYSYLPSVNKTYTGRNAGDQLGHAYVANAETKNWIIENILTYTKDIKLHHIDVTALYSAQNNTYTASSISANTFIDDAVIYNDLAAASIVTATSNFTQYTLISQMGRINYSYAGKYLFTATARRDGFSGFGKYTDKFATFPSVALGWNISKEALMDNLRKVVNNLKLRVSYGTTGNSAISPYQTNTTLSVNDYSYLGTTAIGLTASTIGNNNLKWESTNGFNLGLDFSLFNNRINGTVETYATNTNNLLMKRNLPAVTGYPFIWDNIGKLHNTGIEFSLTTVNIKTEDFSWETNLNFSANRNKITALYGDNKSDTGNLWFLGKSLGVVYDYQKTGVWQTGEDVSTSDPTSKPGYLKFKDRDGNGTITSTGDKTYLGSTLPKWIGAITNTFRYKNFQFSFFIQTFQGAIKSNPILNFADQAGATDLPEGIGYWTTANKSNTRPSLAFTNNRGYAYPTDASYTRIKDVTLSYNLPKQFFDKYGFSSFSVYISGRNLHTFTNWIGWDPENTYSSNYPLVASYVMGINITLK